MNTNQLRSIELDRMLRIVDRRKREYVPAMYLAVEKYLAARENGRPTLEQLIDLGRLRNNLNALVSLVNIDGILAASYGFVYLGSGPCRGQFNHQHKGKRRRSHAIKPMGGFRRAWLWTKEGKIKESGIDLDVAAATARYHDAMAKNDKDDKDWAAGKVPFSLDIQLRTPERRSHRSSPSPN